MTNEKVLCLLGQVRRWMSGDATDWEDAMESLLNVIEALEAKKVLAEVAGWMTPVHFCGKKRLRPGDNLSGLVSGDRGKTRRAVTVTITEEPS